METQHAHNLSTEQERIYDNKSLMALLGIKERYLKRLRDNGLFGYYLTATNTGTPNPTSTASSPAVITTTSRMKESKNLQSEYQF